MGITATKPAINLREKLNELDFDKVPFQKMPAGSVLQVVEDTNTTTQSLSTTSWIDTNLSLSITPHSISSKILLQYNFQEVHVSGTGGKGISIRFVRDGIAIYTPNEGYAFWAHDSIHLPIGDMAIDYPNTVSTITYKLEVRCHNTNLVYLNHQGNFKDTFIAMEIAQ